MGKQEKPDLVPGKVPPGHGPERPAKENVPDTRGFLHPQVNFQLCNCEQPSLAGSAWKLGLRRRALLSESEGLWRGRIGAPGWGLGAAGRCVVGDGSSRQGFALLIISSGWSLPGQKVHVPDVTPFEFMCKLLSSQLMAFPNKCLGKILPPVCVHMLSSRHRRIEKPRSAG